MLCQEGLKRHRPPCQDRPYCPGASAGGSEERTLGTTLPNMHTRPRPRQAPPPSDRHRRSSAITLALTLEPLPRRLRPGRAGPAPPVILCWVIAFGSVFPVGDSRQLGGYCSVDVWIGARCFPGCPPDRPPNAAGKAPPCFLVWWRQ